MKANLKTTLLHFIISLIPLMVLLFFWNNLRDQVPMHYSGGKADRFGSKYEFTGLIIFFVVFANGMSLLLRFANRIDPKQRGKEVSGVMKKIATVVVIFLTLLPLVIIFSTLEFSKDQTIVYEPKYAFALISLFIAVLGNFMNNLKPNFLVGMRTPWALTDEDNWRKTHHLAGRIWFFGGLLMALLALLLAQRAAETVFFSGMAVLTIWPFVYSYRLFSQKKKEG